MKAGDVKCRRCGTGFKDIAPDYDFASRGPLAVETFTRSFGTCLQGHRMIVETSWPGDVAQHVVVDVVDPPA